MSLYINRNSNIMSVRSGSHVIALLALVCFSAALSAADSRPNIILIVSDNQSHTLLGTYGNGEIKTPHIDNLAKQYRSGVRFNNAFCSEWCHMFPHQGDIIYRVNAIADRNSCCLTLGHRCAGLVGNRRISLTSSNTFRSRLPYRAGWQISFGYAAKAPTGISILGYIPIRSYHYLL